MERTDCPAWPLGALLILGLLLVGIAGCGGTGELESGLSDRLFERLAVDVVRLHRQYAGQPDSLAAGREALLRRHGLTPDDIERFIAQRQEDPDAWGGILRAVEQGLKRDAAVSGALDSEVRRALKIPAADTSQSGGRP